jgi:hypothetical protein
MIDLYGYARVPALGTSCPVDQSSLALWVGIGGGSPGLIQNGWTIGHGTANSSGLVPFWEILGPSPLLDTKQVEGFGQPAASGELVYSEVYYRGAIPDPTHSNQLANTVTFGFIDAAGTWTIAVNHWTKQMQNHDVSSYYDGRVAEAIDERTSHTVNNVSVPYQLRQFPNSQGWATVYAKSAQSPVQGIGSFDDTSVFMVGDTDTPPFTRPISRMFHDAFNSDNVSWNDVWSNCQ